MNEHERAFLGFVAKHIPLDALVVDIGANIGSLTDELRQRFPDAIIWAYKPIRALAVCCPIGLPWMPESTSSIKQWIVRAKMLNPYLCRGCKCPERASAGVGQE